MTVPDADGEYIHLQLRRFAGGPIRAAVTSARLGGAAFPADGRRDARDLAVALVASYQGISLITNTFGDQQLMVREGRRLEHWIDSLA